jgi:hypothetical protein
MVLLLLLVSVPCCHQHICDDKSCSIRSLHAQLLIARHGLALLLLLLRLLLTSIPSNICADKSWSASSRCCRAGLSIARQGLPLLLLASSSTVCQLWPQQQLLLQLVLLLPWLLLLQLVALLVRLLLLVLLATIPSRHQHICAEQSCSVSSRRCHAGPSIARQGPPLLLLASSSTVCKLWQQQQLLLLLQWLVASSSTVCLRWWQQLLLLLQLVLLLSSIPSCHQHICADKSCSVSSRRCRAGLFIAK